MNKKKSSVLLALVMAGLMSVSLFTGCKKNEIQDTVPDTSAQAVTPVADTWTCPACGATGISSKFCPDCGEAKDWTCASCGQSGITSKFCPSCGSPKGGAPEETTVGTTETTTVATTTQAPATTTQAPATTAAPVVTTKAPVVTTAAPVTTTTAKVTDAPSNYVKNANRYVYGTLTDDEKRAYVEIYNGMKNREERITPSVKLSSDRLKEIAKDVIFQEPSCYMTLKIGIDGDTVICKYDFTASEAAAMDKACENAMSKIQAKFPANASDFDKVKAIHDYIVQNTVFSKDNKYSVYAYGPLVAGVGQCEGYTKAMTYAFTYFGIESVRMVGTKYDGASHAWNKVKVAGKWYNIDATWAEFYNDKQSTATKYSFFLIPDAGVMSGSGRNYIPQCSFTPPSATSWDSNYFVKTGKYATSMEDAKAKMQAALIEAAKNKQEVIQIKCSDKALHDEMRAWLKANYQTLVTTANNTPGCYKFTTRSFGDTSFLTTDKNIVELVVTYQ